MPFKLIIFDLDGTLVDSLADITNAVNYALSPVCVGEQSKEDIRPLVGGGISGLLSGLLGKDNISFLDEAVERFIFYYNDHTVDYTYPYDGVEGVLKELSSNKLGVISNKRASLVKKVLSELGLAHYFGQMYGSDSSEEKKPSAVPVLKMMDFFSAAASETMIIGDGEADIGAGQAAGITTVSVTYGYRSREKLFGADYFIDNIRALPHLLGSL